MDFSGTNFAEAIFYYVNTVHSISLIFPSSSFSCTIYSTCCGRLHCLCVCYTTV